MTILFHLLAIVVGLIMLGIIVATVGMAILIAAGCVIDVVGTAIRDVVRHHRARRLRLAQEAIRQRQDRIQRIEGLEREVMDTSPTEWAREAAEAVG